MELQTLNSQNNLEIEEQSWGTHISQFQKFLQRYSNQNTEIGLPWWSSEKESALPMQETPGLIPGQGTRSHMHATTTSLHATNTSLHAATKRILHASTKHAEVRIPRAAARTQYSHKLINK